MDREGALYNAQWNIIQALEKQEILPFVTS